MCRGLENTFLHWAGIFKPTRETHDSSHLVFISIHGHRQMQVRRHRCRSDCDAVSIGDVQMACDVQSGGQCGRGCESQQALHPQTLPQYLQTHTHHIVSFVTVAAILYCLYTKYTLKCSHTVKCGSFKCVEIGLFTRLLKVSVDSLLLVCLLTISPLNNSSIYITCTIIML